MLQRLSVQDSLAGLRIEEMRESRVRREADRLAGLRHHALAEYANDVVVAGAKALRDMLDGGDAVARNYKTVMDREHDADNITREVLIAVRRTFITPFDRGDVKDLITSMDNTIDQMQKTAKTIMLFDQRSFTEQQKEMADAIVTSAAEPGCALCPLKPSARQNGSLYTTRVLVSGPAIALR